MDKILPIIPISQLQRCAHRALDEIEDYAVIQSHNKDVAFVLHPDLGKVLLKTGMLEKLKNDLHSSDVKDVKKTAHTTSH
ncbi:MAG: hypothetical protein AAB544_01250 [Patescibacteria group bacterium]